MRQLYQLLLIGVFISVNFCCRKTHYPGLEKFAPLIPPTNLPLPPASLRLSSFYKKYVDANGIPIISSEYTVDDALLRAKQIVLTMMGSLSDPVKDQMIFYKVRVGIISQYEKLNSLPENAFLPDSMDQRSRGSGAFAWQPLCSTAEENLMCDKNMILDRWAGQDVLTHEFAHTILSTGLMETYPDFENELMATFNEARSNELWDSTYSATNYSEYWAVGVTCWFNCAFQVIPANGVYNYVNTRDELRSYDPKLYHLIERFFTSLSVKNGCH